MGERGHNPNFTQKPAKLEDIRNAKIEIFSEDEARSIVNAESTKVDSVVQKIIGKEQADQITAYFDDPEIKDLEVTMLSGGMTMDEMFEYAFLIPQVQHIFQLIDQLSIDIATHIRKNTWEYTKNNKIFRENKLDARKLIEFETALNDTIAKGVKSPQMRLMQESLYRFMYACIQREVHNFIWSDLEQKSGGALSVLNNFDKRGVLADDKEYSFADELLTEYILKNSKLKTGLEEKLSEDTKTTEEDLFNLMNEISGMSVEGATSIKETDVDGVTITLDPLDQTNIQVYLLQRPVFLCHGSVSMPIKEDAQSSSGKSSITDLAKEMHFYFYRFTGELVDRNNFSLSNHFSEDAVDNLKFKILTILKKSNSKKEEARELLGESEKPIKAENKATKALTAIKSIFTKPEAEKKEKGVEKKEAEISSISGLKGVKGSRIKQALIKILGEPLRITGSHHIFKCRNGKTYPISLHPAEAVGVGLLTKCLRKFGVSPVELKAELP